MSGEAEKTERAYVYMVRCAGGQLYTRAGPMTPPPGSGPTRAARGPSTPGHKGRWGLRTLSAARIDPLPCAGRSP